MKHVDMVWSLATPWTKLSSAAVPRVTFQAKYFRTSMPQDLCHNTVFFWGRNDSSPANAEKWDLKMEVVSV